MHDTVRCKELKGLKFSKTLERVGMIVVCGNAENRRSQGASTTGVGDSAKQSTLSV
jgi:hypothetical protein